LLHEHAGPFTLHKCYEQMELSLSYKTKVVHQPEGIHYWRAINAFTNDGAYISMHWLLHLMSNCGHHVEYLLCIKHVGTTSTHFLAILPNGEYICDCCMGINLGVPCHHYFQVLLKMPTLQFHIGLV
ncbi:hypothetical protein L208DRAFT_1157530, partial [Tricholoma matsutake]